MPTAQVIDASTAKNAFGSLAAKAREAPVEITRHGRVESVLISPQLYEQVKALEIVGRDELASLQGGFDQLVIDMQSQRSAAAYDALDAIGSKDLARAVAKARKQVAKTASGAAKRKLRVVR